MDRAAIDAAREILTRLHDVMAARTHAQAKLNTIVEVIGEGLDSEVCSIYLLREGMLELFATRGLAQEAVHVTRMGIGEGLVGTIAQDSETLNLAEAAAHPDFSYRPETGEDKFHSFAGVPIVHRERVVGVLSVQHVDPRRYQEVEIETLQTVAMVLSELIASAGLIDEEDRGGPGSGQSGPEVLRGLTLVKGLAIGNAVYHQPRVTIEHVVAENTEAERQRVLLAFDRMREQIDKMANQAEFGVAGEHVEVIETYKMFAYDEGWARRINEAIDSGLTAEAAIERVQQHTRMRMRQIDDPLLADRMHDLEDLANRLLRIVSGQLGTAASKGLRSDTVLIARNLGPAELLEYDRRRLKGVILEEGSLTSHVVIVARAMGIPVLGRVRGLRGLVREGEELLLDTEQGTVTVRPIPAMIESFEARTARYRERQAAYAAMRDVEPVSKDGQRITVMINAGLREDIANLSLTGADGIGLFRTEFQFLVSATLPARERQTRLYREVLDAAGDKPVVFRSLDVGGDKILPYMRQAEEPNPALGWRAIRISLDRPALLKAQMRALLRAASGRELSIMFPMISEVREFDQARAIVDADAERLKSFGHELPTAIRLGVMVEVPALIWQIDELAGKADFLSIGSNDLFQFLYAVDRENARLSNRFDPLCVPVVRVLKDICEAAERNRLSLSLCGELASHPLTAMALAAVGLRTISMSAAAVGPVKAMLQSLDVGKARAFLDDRLADASCDLRKELRRFAQDNGVEIDE